MRSRARIVEFASIATAAAVIGASALTVETVEMEILPDQQLDAVQKFEKKVQTQVVEEIVEVEKEVPRNLAMPSIPSPFSAAAEAARRIESRCGHRQAEKFLEGAVLKE